MKPPGAIAGGGFTVVNGMTSLTGASGEDFASILRSLGYRMERRPKPAEPAPAAAPAEQVTTPAEQVAAPVETASLAESNPEVQTPSVVEGEAAAARESVPKSVTTLSRNPWSGAATGGGFGDCEPDGGTRRN